jgi:hypothetical protein
MVKLGLGCKRLINRRYIDKNHIHRTSELFVALWKYPPHSLLPPPLKAPLYRLLVDFCASVNVY